jgi:hypothetical protein
VTSPPISSITCTANGTNRYSVIFASGRPIAVFRLIFRRQHGGQHVRRRIWARARKGEERMAPAAAVAAIAAARMAVA